MDSGHPSALGRAGGRACLRGEPGASRVRVPLTPYRVQRVHLLLARAARNYAGKAVTADPRNRF